MNEYRKLYPDLGSLLGAFFHQRWEEDLDWQGESPNYRAVVRFYKTLCSPTELDDTRKQLQRFLALLLDEDQTEDIVSDEFHCAFYPPGGGQTYRQWLEDVLRILDEPVTPSRLRYLDPKSNAGHTVDA